MKKEYIKPELEIVEFEAEDVMSTSGVLNVGKEGDGFGDWKDTWGL